MFFSSDASKIGVVETQTLPILQLKLREAGSDFTEPSADTVSGFVILVNQLIKATYDFVAQQEDLSYASIVQPKVELDKLNHDAVLLLFEARKSGGSHTKIEAIAAGLESTYHAMQVNSRRDDVFFVLQKYFNTIFLARQGDMNIEEQRAVVSMLRDFAGRDADIDAFVASSRLETDFSNLLPPLLTRCKYE